jgi:hypothetical protein
MNALLSFEQPIQDRCIITLRLYFNKQKRLLASGLTPEFETGVKTPFKQPVAGIVPVTGCLVSFEYGYGYNK